MNDPIARRLLQCVGFLLIGDGVMGMIKPRWHSLLWRLGPQLVQAATEELADHPKTARTIYFAEAAIGIALASLQTPEID